MYFINSEVNINCIEIVKCHYLCKKKYKTFVKEREYYTVKKSII